MSFSWLKIRCGMLWLLMLTVSSQVWGEEPNAAAPERQVFAKLLSKSFQERVEAQQELLELSEKQPEKLAFWAADAQPDVALRILNALEITFLKHADELGDRVEQAMMLLSEESAPIGAIAYKTLLKHGRLREERARKAITALGGEFTYINPFKLDRRLMAYRNIAIAPGVGVGFGPPALLQSVWLHENWKGTNKDLWHLTRLIHCPDLGLYSIRGNGVDLNDLYRLVSIVPGLSIAERGPCLGIRSTPFGGTHCEVGSVLPFSSAAKAGLRQGDAIYELNGDPIRSFSHLVESLQAFEIGDVIELSIIRSLGKPKVVEVTLGSWRGIAQGSEDYAPPPSPFGGPFAKPIRSEFPPPVPLPEAGIHTPL